MERDIDQIILRLKTEISGVQISQLQVVDTKADDNGLWFIKTSNRVEEVQIESSSGNCPFVIESDFGSERFCGHNVEEVVSIVKKLYS